jgi:hypothetical protein
MGITLDFPNGFTSKHGDLMGFTSILPMDLPVKHGDFPWIFRPLSEARRRHVTWKRLKDLA